MSPAKNGGDTTLVDKAVTVASFSLKSTKSIIRGDLENPVDGEPVAVR